MNEKKPLNQFYFKYDDWLPIDGKWHHIVVIYDAINNKKVVWVNVLKS